MNTQNQRYAAGPSQGGTAPSGGSECNERGGQQVYDSTLPYPRDLAGHGLLDDRCAEQVVAQPRDEV